MKAAPLMTRESLSGPGPWVQPRVPAAWLLAAAVLSLALWQIVERGLAMWPHPANATLRAAADHAGAAQREIAQAKQQFGLLQDAATDPNRTGLIGPDWSEITTTLGDLPAKRTVTNPDWAAAIARLLARARVARSGQVAVVLSGSFVGANIAAIAAIETLGLQPVIISSLGASMFGATDPEFTWIDMEEVLVGKGLWHVRSLAVVLGGESALGNSLSASGREMLVEAARRRGYEPIAGADFGEVKQRVQAHLSAVAPRGFDALVSVGGAVLALGTCADAYRIPSGLVLSRIGCRDGVPGLIHDFAAQGTPVIHLLNVKRLALDWGLPYDPVPLPKIGTNKRVYSRAAYP